VRQRFSEESLGGVDAKYFEAVGDLLVAGVSITDGVFDGTVVLLRKPEQTALGGPPEEARRVEVRLVD